MLWHTGSKNLVLNIFQRELAYRDRQIEEIMVSCRVDINIISIATKLPCKMHDVNIRGFQNKCDPRRRKLFCLNEKFCVVMKIRTILIGPDFYRYSRMFSIIVQKSLLFL